MLISGLKGLKERFVVINLLNNTTIILLNLVEYPLILVDSVYMASSAKYQTIFSEISQDNIIVKKYTVLITKGKKRENKEKEQTKRYNYLIAPSVQKVVGTNYPRKGTYYNYLFPFLKRAESIDYYCT